MQVTTATENISTTWAKKLELKAKRQAIAAMEQEMKDAKRQEIEVVYMWTVATTVASGPDHRNPETTYKTTHRAIVVIENLGPCDVA